jgi:1,4-dihydroxy-2-naphthoate polyprenyltransferase
MTLAVLSRALRWPFLTASVFPYLFGALLLPGALRLLPFALGLAAVAALHLSANLLNDYSDSQSGADWKDETYYGFFGGSKLIQEGRLSAAFYRNGAALFAAVAFLAVVILAVLLRNPGMVGLFAGVLLLAWAYSHRPLQLSYRRLGEAAVFLLFGPATVLGGAFIQLGHWPPPQVLLASLPFGFLTAAILVANEVPDHADDAKSGKRNWVGWIGPERAFVLYGLLLGAGCIASLALFASGLVRPLALIGLLAAPLGWRAASILRAKHGDKLALLQSSRLTIGLHAIVSLGLILGLRP